MAWVSFNSIKTSVNYLWPFKSKNRSEANEFDGNQAGNIIKILGPWEGTMVSLQSIFIWERPFKSAVAVLFVNMFYWYFALKNINFIHAASIIALLLFIYHQWIYYIWPEIRVTPSDLQEHEDWTTINPSVLSAPEIGRVIEDSIVFLDEQKSRMWQLRRKHPGLFCLISNFWFIMLGLLGSSVKLVNLLYFIIMCVMCGPAIFIHLIPRSVYSQISHAKSILFGSNRMDESTTSIENEMAEFLPEEESEDAQSALIIPLTSNTDDKERKTKVKKSKKLSKRNSSSGKSKSKVTSTATGAENSLTYGLNDEDFPSIIDDTTETLEESDLALPEMISHKKKQREEDMTFVGTHFGDSSEESEEEFVNGLIFRDTIDGRKRTIPQETMIIPQETMIPSSAATVGNAAAAASLLMENFVSPETASNILATISQQLVSAMSSNVPEKPPSPHVYDRDDPNDEDFELISDNEL